MALNMSTAVVTANQVALNREEEIPPEILAAIVAAATAFLGANIHIRSAQLMRSSQEQASRWSQQGRKLAQTSHDVRLRQSPIRESRTIEY